MGASIAGDMKNVIFDKSLASSWKWYNDYSYYGTPIGTRM